MRKFFCTAICLLALLLTACGVKAPGESPADTAPGNDATVVDTEPAPEETVTLSEAELEILAQRRDAAEAEMRRLMTMLWRSDVDITYSKSGASKGVSVDQTLNPGDVLTILAGRVYSGLPYTHGSASGYAFSSYADFQDAHGIYTFTGMDSVMLSGGSNYTGSNRARLGNDCADSVYWSWGKIASSITFPFTKQMTEEYGCLKVGSYEAPGYPYISTRSICNDNGTDVMFAAYARLQKADAVVHYNNNAGHAMMIVSVEVVMDGDKIDPGRSVVTVLEQYSTNFKKGVSYYDETLGETVYRCGGVDNVYTFQKLFNTGYLPVTCKELIDPSPLAGETVEDSESIYTKDNIFAGMFTSPYRISDVTVTITDGAGQTVQQVTGYGVEKEMMQFNLSRFASPTEQEVLKGAVDPDSLAPGTYRCTHVCRISTGAEITVRDFEFTV